MKCGHGWYQECIVADSACTEGAAWAPCRRRNQVWFVSRADGRALAGGWVGAVAARRALAHARALAGGAIKGAKLAVAAAKGSVQAQAGEGRARECASRWCRLPLQRAAAAALRPQPQLHVPAPMQHAPRAVMAWAATGSSHVGPHPT